MDEINSNPLLYDDDVPEKIIRDIIAHSLEQAKTAPVRHWDFVPLPDGRSWTPEARIPYLVSVMELKQPRVQRAHDGFTTGYRDLDRIVGGFHPGELTVVSALPSSGTSTLLQNVARKTLLRGLVGHENAKTENTPTQTVSQGAVAFFSMETPESRIAMRLLCAEAKVSQHSVVSAALLDREYARLTEAKGRLGKLPLHLDDTWGRTTDEIFVACEEWKRRRGLDLIIVDRLNAIGTNGSGVQPPLAHVVEDLKSVAQELQTPVLAAYTIDPSVVADDVYRQPRLQNLPPAVAVYSDVVALLHRPEHWMPSHLLADDRNRALSGMTDVQKGLEVLEFSVLHQVGGEPDTARLAFNKSWCRIDNILWDDV